MKSKKCFFLSLLVVMNYISYAQNKEIFVLDNATKLPIETVNLYYPNIQEGTFTNAEGQAVIHVVDSNLKISHLGYEEKIINTNETDLKQFIIIAEKRLR